jgi:hypothetical protein
MAKVELMSRISGLYKETLILNSYRAIKVTFSKFCLENLEMNSNIYIKINIEGSEFFLLKEIFKFYGFITGLKLQGSTS